MTNPYANLPDHQYWRRSVAVDDLGAVDPVIKTPFQISRTDKVATAGSCFAQHISRHLQASGFDYLISENGLQNSFQTPENFGVFSARYGNIYTVRQLLQLFDRAYGLRMSTPEYWTRADGRFIDPFRPRIQEAGFKTVEDVLADRSLHLAAVRAMFEDCAVFVFTLGLTEGWVSAVDGSVYPLAPGTVGVSGDRSDCVFKNFDVLEMRDDLNTFVERLRVVNPQCRIILTVSPVALVATYEPDHVLNATIYSKSALRVVAEMVSRQHAAVAYFPSYEIITGPQARGRFFEADLRSVTPEGVAHVMAIFGRHYLSGETSSPMPPLKSLTSPGLLVKQEELLRQLQGIVCDEEVLDRQV